MKYLKYFENIDPFGEEDWDEHELDKKLYIVKTTIDKEDYFLLVSPKPETGNLQLVILDIKNNALILDKYYIKKEILNDITEEEKNNILNNDLKVGAFYLKLDILFDPTTLDVESELVYEKEFRLSEILDIVEKLGIKNDDIGFI